MAVPLLYFVWKIAGSDLYIHARTRITASKVKFIATHSAPPESWVFSITRKSRTDGMDPSSSLMLVM